MSVYNQSRRRTAAKPRRIGKALRATSFAIAGGLSSVIALSLGTAQAQGLPQQGNIVAGSGAISSPDSLASHISQISDRLVIDWDSFNIGKDKQVVFSQPGAQSIALNRVIGSQGSQILGQLTANGQVFLVNPNGVLFGPSARVDVGGLVASTLSLGTERFMQSWLSNEFSGGSAPGSVLNQGVLNAADGGYIALFGGQVLNQGVIKADLGTVALMANRKVWMILDQPGSPGNSKGPRFVGEVKSTPNVQASNSGYLRAQGGLVQMEARASLNPLQAVVNNQGLIEAQTLDGRSGKIILNGGRAGTMIVAGTLDVSSASGDAGVVRMDGHTIQLGASMLGRATGAVGGGGSIEVQGRQIQMTATSSADMESVSMGAGLVALRADEIAIGRDVQATGSEIDANRINHLLRKSNVFLMSERGDIRVADAIDWNSDRVLVLTALGDVKLDAYVKVAGRYAGLVLQPGSGRDYVLAPGARVTLSGEHAGFMTGSMSYTVIRNAKELQAIDQNRGGLYVLGNDIDASETRNWNLGDGFRPLAQNGAFSGVLNGLGNEVKGLYIAAASDSTPTAFIGMSSGTIRNLALKDLSVLGAGQYIGGLVGQNFGRIDRVSVTGHVLGNPKRAVVNEYIGGLAGFNQGSIKNASFSGKVSIPDSQGINRLVLLGGLVGSNNGEIQHSFTDASISVGGQARVRAGGLVGDNERQGRIVSSRAFGEVVSPGDIGGLVGLNRGSIQDAHAWGNVSDGATLGGLVGTNVGSIEDSSAVGMVSSNREYAFAGGLVGENSGRITRSHAVGAVQAGYFASHMGGLVGRNLGGSISQASASGDVGRGSSGQEARYVQAGGLVGSNESIYSYDRLLGRYVMKVAVIADSQATGNVEARGDDAVRVGGLAGYNTGLITNSYAKGKVSGQGTLGSLVGLNAFVDRQALADMLGQDLEEWSFGPLSTIRQSMGSGWVNGIAGPQVGINDGVVE